MRNCVFLRPFQETTEACLRPVMLVVDEIVRSGEPRAKDEKIAAMQMPATGRLLLLETVIPENDSKHFGKILDLNMMAMSSGRERTRTEFCALLTAAGFRMSKITATLAPQSLIEAVP